MTVVLDDIHGGKDPGTCGMALGPAMAVAAEVQALLPSLRFNNLVSGEWMLQRNHEEAPSPLGGRPVVSGLRKLSAPASWFHPVPATPNCQNRSGRLDCLHQSSQRSPDRLQRWRHPVPPHSPGRCLRASICRLKS